MLKETGLSIELQVLRWWESHQAVHVWLNSTAKIISHLTFSSVRKITFDNQVNYKEFYQLHSVAFVNGRTKYSILFGHQTIIFDSATIQSINLASPKNPVELEPYVSLVNFQGKISSVYHRVSLI